MTSLVFVHGINTRGGVYDAASHQVKRALEARRGGVRVVPCRWGDDLGARLLAGGASIPRYDLTRDATVPGGGPADDTDLWGWLDPDPLAELRLLALRPAPPPAEFNPLGGETPVQAVESRVREASQAERLGAVAAGTGLSAADWAGACHAVIFDPAFAAAVRATADDPELLDRAWARAAVARAIADQPRAPVASDPSARDAAVDALAGVLTGGLRPRGAVGGWFEQALAAFGTRHARDRRGRYTEQMVPVVGDVLVYQGHGRAIRQRIRDSLPEAGPVVLLAHSLGGVACVDLLVEAALPQVELLVTVGSQAPFFYEIDALQALRFGTPLPGHFPRWLNVYDLRDFLSYIAGKVFAGVPNGVTDVLVDNRLPFPRSHSGYWLNPQTWDAVVPALP
jgi:hypothetical protein